ncbi:MAG: FkbM family methyltransferase [Flavobacteriaceae bacterium]|nr:MAG: FkbM family methyltransferase [Flavobacteriaceae bacterium]
MKSKIKTNLGRLKRFGSKFSLFKGQKGQDKWVIFNVMPFKRGGFFLDLAASDGITHNNTYVLEKLFGWTGICIEPNPQFFQKLRSTRKCIVDSSVISNKNEKVQFRIDNGMLGGIIDDDTDNNFRIRGEQLVTAETIILDALPLNELLDRYHAPVTIDYFSLDVEGSEERIISSIDFQKYHFLCLTIERPTPKVNKILFENGYLFVKNYKYDSFYVHSSLSNMKLLKFQPFEQIPPKTW